jgi:hypothetical protein
MKEEPCVNHRESKRAGIEQCALISSDLE